MYQKFQQAGSYFPYPYQSFQMILLFAYIFIEIQCYWQNFSKLSRFSLYIFQYSNFVEQKAFLYQLFYQYQILNYRLVSQMNTSPFRIKQINNQQTQQSQTKPRVAFVYQNNFTGTNIANQPHQLTYGVQQKYQASKGSCQIIQKAFNTPKKIDKQNSQAFSPPLCDMKILTNGQTMPIQKKIENPCLKSNISNYYLAINKSNSPKHQYFPPLSPKISNKKLNKCPSFLSNKSKNQEQFITETSMQSQSKITSNQQNFQNCKCGKFATHQTQFNEKCCSKCGIAKMLEGCSVIPIPNLSKKSLAQQFSPKLTMLNKISHITAQKKQKPQKFLKEIKESKINLQKHYKQSLQGEDRKIHQFYKQRKNQLKKHYEKIKTAIKESIQLDLKQLQILEQEQILEWRRSVEILSQDIKKLQKISIQIEAQNYQSKIKQNYIQQYQEIIAKNKIQRNERGSTSQGLTEIDTINISRISNLTNNNLSSLNVTIILKNFNVNAQVYKPQIYRMVSTNTRSEPSQRNSDLISLCSQAPFSPRNQSPVLVPYLPQIEEQINGQKVIHIDISKKISSQQQKNMLFSFQTKK